MLHVRQLRECANASVGPKSRINGPKYFAAIDRHHTTTSTAAERRLHGPLRRAGLRGAEDAVREERLVFVTGSGSCPSIPPRLEQATQCFENPTAYPPLGGSSQVAMGACGSARHAHRPCSVDGTTMLLNTCLIAAPVDAHTPPAPRCSLTGLPCPALAMAGPS